MATRTAPPLALSPRLFASLFLLGVAGCLLLLARPDSALLSRPFIEDAFLDLSVARNLAAGHGLSADGAHATNGIQPLIVCLDATLFRLAGHDQARALRYCLALQVALFAGAALAFGRLMGRVVPPGQARRALAPLGTLAFLFNYPLATNLLNGLETGLGWLLMLVLLGTFDRRADRLSPSLPGSEEAAWPAWGALGGLAILARIDAVALVLVIALAHGAGWGRRAPFDARAARRRWLEAAGFAGVAGLISLPWWLYNVLVFGHLMPISGRALQVADPGRVGMLSVSLKSLASAALVVVHLDPGRPLGWTSLAGLILPLVALLTFRGSCHALPVRVAPAPREVTPLRLLPLLPLLLHACVLTLFYTFAHRAPHFQPRYLLAWRVLALALALVTALRLAEAAAWRMGRPGLRRVAAVAGVALVALAGGLFARNWSGARGNIMLAPAAWIATHALPGERIGMFQSGTTGFLCPRVINLDGKVNAAATEALEAGRLPEYVASLRLDTLIDWDVYTRRVLGHPALRGAFVAVDTVGEGFVVWRARERLLADRGGAR